MEIEKQKIIDLIEKVENRAMRFKEIANALAVFGKEDEKKLEQAIIELEEEGIILKNAKGKYCLVRDLGYYPGRFIANERGFGFVNVPDLDDDLFIMKENTNCAVNGDTVLVEIIKQKEDNGRKAEGKVFKVVKRNNNVIIGKFELSKSFGFVVPDDNKIIYDIYIPKENINGAKDNDKVIVKVLKWPEGDRKANGKIVEVLGKDGDPKLDFVSVVKMYGVKDKFDKETLQEVSKVKMTIPQEEIEKRRDLRNELIFTIDSAHTKDIDDAIHVKKISDDQFELGVHIADVSHYVREGTHLNDEAIERATSVYLLNKVIPMLPPELSNGVCSLNENEDRLAISVIMQINKKGKVTSYEVCKSVIHSRKKGVYSEINDILDKKKEAKYDEYEPLLETIENMKALEEILWNQRVKRGSIEFDLYESEIILDENDVAVDIQKNVRGLSEQIIEECMLIANETIAEAFCTKEIPFIYRIHEKPDEEKISMLAKILNNLNIKFKGTYSNLKPKVMQEILNELMGQDSIKMVSTMMLRSMQQAKYSEQNMGHFGLANEYYCHFTSPIRRYPDLFVHRMITKALENNYILDSKTKEKYVEQATEYSHISSVQERNAEKAERELEAIKKCEYMENKIGQEYTGIISGLTSFGMFIELENTVEGLVRYETMDGYYNFNEENMCTTSEVGNIKYVIGDKVNIRVIGASKKLRRIDFELI